MCFFIFLSKELNIRKRKWQKRKVGGSRSKEEVILNANLKIENLNPRPKIG